MTIAAVVLSGARSSGARAPIAAPTTAKVEQGTLVATVSVTGTLAYGGRPDGSPSVAVDQARGTYTWLPDVGASIACGDVLYRVDDRPVLLLCGSVPTYRDVQLGDGGSDVRQLNANLHALGADADAPIDPADPTFSATTRRALERLQRDRGAPVSGKLTIDGAVVLPEAARVAKVSADLGAPAQPGAPVLSATSPTLEVQVDLEGTQQREVKPGARATITLPDDTSVTGRVDRLGTVAQTPSDKGDNSATKTTIRAHVALDDPAKAVGLDQAPVRVEITTAGVDAATSVPVTAVVGKAGGGYGVEVLRVDGRRDVVAVELGVFDSTHGRVQVIGAVHAGDAVVVPSS